MTNRHFGKFADVWKHLVLNEVLDATMPTRYAETHAGSAAYPLVRDAERQYGVLGFLAWQTSAELSSAGYTQVVSSFLNAHPALYPGSALQAMTVLGADSDYRLCDLEPASANDLRAWAHRLRLDCEIIEGNGMSAVEDWLPGPVPAVVHIDPFDPFERQAAAPSAIELASTIADAGHTLVYWYGYSSPAERGWAAEHIHSGTTAPLWWGDFMVTSADGSVRHDGDLGEATTPGTGCGVVLANATAQVIDTCNRLSNALVHTYADRELASGEPGRVDAKTGQTT